MADTRAGALLRLFKETVSLYWRLNADSAAIHGVGELSGPRRTILLALHETGPQTVAHLARSRAQARQRLQPVINSLVDDGLVAAQPNPMHKRSPLMVLTTGGERRVRQILKKETALLARLRPASSSPALLAAAAVLQDVRETLRDQLPPLLRGAAPRRKPR
jgi:DNA-binding MarR family transcriptional regulator